MKGRNIIIPEILKMQAQDQLHINHMGIEKTKFLACESIYWANINDDIENLMKNCTTCLTFKHTQPKEKIHHDIQVRPWDVIGSEMFIVNNNPCIILALQTTIVNSQLSRRLPQ